MKKRPTVLILLLMLLVLLTGCSGPGSGGAKPEPAGSSQTASTLKALPLATPQGDPAPAVADQLSKETAPVVPAWAGGTAAPVASPALTREESMLGHVPDNPREPVTLSPLMSADTSRLNGTMSYAEMFNILNNLDQYLGKTLRLRGSYYSLPLPHKNKVMHILVVTDNSLCCEVGLEFFLTGSPVYPEDFPKHHSLIDLTGVLEQYDNAGTLVPALVVNEIQVIREGQ